MIRVETEIVSNLKRGRIATLEEQVDYEEPGHYCGRQLRHPNGANEWVCTRAASKPHNLHIALAGTSTFCASWYEWIIIEEDPDMDDEMFT